MTRTMSQARTFFVFISILMAGIITAELFTMDHDQNVLDFTTYYVKLSNSSHSSIHCGLLCVVKLGTCSYYVYDATTTTCYGRPNTAFVPYNPGELTLVKSRSKMVSITNRQKEFRSCVLERGGILVGITTCLHFSKEAMNELKAINYCQNLEQQLFEPRSEGVSGEYKLPMLERGYNESNPYWIGLHFVASLHSSSGGIYKWRSDAREASYTDWCTGNCSTSPPQPDEPASQHCVTTVFLLNTGPFGWWDKPCSSEFHAICETTLSGTGN